MKVTRQDILAPANVITLVGFALTVVGCFHLETKVGFSEAVIGRLLDVLDGPVARRTHTSRFGAVLDATVDKFSILALVTGLLAYDLAPRYIVLFILVQHGIIATMNLIAAHRKIIISTVLSGKRNIFLQITSMLTFVLASFAHGTAHTLIATAAYIAFVCSLYYAIHATLSYMKHHSPR